MALMFPTHVIIEGRVVADAEYDDSKGALWSTVSRRAAPSGRRRIRPSECDHEQALPAFAYGIDNFHWPIRFCPACHLILEGRSPWAAPRSGPGMEAADVIAAAWMKAWPKPGRPRRHHPPPQTVWPEEEAA